LVFLCVVGLAVVAGGRERGRGVQRTHWSDSGRKLRASTRGSAQHTRRLHRADPPGSGPSAGGSAERYPRQAESAAGPRNYSRAVQSEPSPRPHHTLRAWPVLPAGWGCQVSPETIRVFSILGRFLEHSRIYCFENAGQPEYYLGSADWMRRNFNNRIETVAPVIDPAIQAELDRILGVFEGDNASAWDLQPDGHYVRRRSGAGQGAAKPSSFSSNSPRRPSPPRGAKKQGTISIRECLPRADQPGGLCPTSRHNFSLHSPPIDSRKGL
jgi:hypothetical protein